MRILIKNGLYCYLKVDFFVTSFWSGAELVSDAFAHLPLVQET